MCCAAVGDGRISPAVVLVVLDCLRWIRDRDGTAGSKQAPFLLRTRKHQASSPGAGLTSPKQPARPRTSPSRSANQAGQQVQSPLSPSAWQVDSPEELGTTTPVRPKSSSAVYSAPRSPLRASGTVVGAVAAVARSESNAAVLHSCVCSAVLLSQLRAIECVKANFRGLASPAVVRCARCLVVKPA